MNQMSSLIRLILIMQNPDCCKNRLLDLKVSYCDHREVGCQLTQDHNVVE